MISYYLDRGHSLKELLSLDYCEQKIYVACMLQNKKEDIEEKVSLNPLIEKR